MFGERGYICCHNGPLCFLFHYLNVLRKYLWVFFIFLPLLLLVWTKRINCSGVETLKLTTFFPAWGNVLSLPLTCWMWAIMKWRMICTFHKQIYCALVDKRLNLHRQYTTCVVKPPTLSFNKTHFIRMSAAKQSPNTTEPRKVRWKLNAVILLHFRIKPSVCRCFFDQLWWKEVDH